MPLATSGARIVDRDGHEVVLQGVNWFGFETAAHLPHGLWVRDYVEMLKQIKELGFNTIRLPYSLQAMRSAEAVQPITTGGMNAALKGKTPLEAMDVIIDEAANQGLLILLDNHSSVDDGFTNPHWFGNGGYTEADWISTWEMLATRYRDRPNILGADLKNEPHGNSSWGKGGPTDWQRAATLAGNAVVAIAPDWLIIVEGTEKPAPGGHLEQNWWGGNLEGVRAKPVELTVPNRVVYSAHEYGPGVYAQSWFRDPNVSQVLAGRWSDGWGYIVDQGIAPVLIGEFGAKNVDIASPEGQWINQLVDYLATKHMSWTYWSWNPNSGDTGGILLDDWRTVNQDKQALLDRLMAAQDGTVPLPTILSTPAPLAPGIVAAEVTRTTSWSTGYCAKVALTNTAAGPVIWTATVPVTGRVRDVWNAVADQTGDQVSLRGMDRNRVMAAGATDNTVGFCTEG